MKPPFTYFGGKTSLAGQIVRLLPPHEHYVEPFAGSLAVLLAKAPSRHPGTLVYADPPYLRSTRTWTNGNGYGHEMLTEDDHRELSETLCAAAAAVVLSGYDSPLYQDLYGGWHRTEIATFNGNATPGERRRTEVLWSNRPFPAAQAGLFDDETPEICAAP